MYHKTLKNKEKIFAVAPMMDWTDRYCRSFHRVLSTKALLYTEMVTADAVIHGDRDHLIGYDEDQHPIALQLGGCEPSKLAEAAKIGEDFGYDEINLNVGCPSSRVQSGRFGAALIADPALVARCVSAMKEAVSCPVTVKCRIGIDDQEPESVLPAFARTVIEAGSDALWVHARKALLDGLSPKDNRTIPPLNYPLVHALKEAHPHHFIGINGGIETIEAASEHLAVMDGVMLGRAAYKSPALLANVDSAIYGDERPDRDLEDYVTQFLLQIQNWLDNGVRLHSITRHMLGLFSGQPGARRWRQILSGKAPEDGADLLLITDALQAVSEEKQKLEAAAA